MSNDCNAVKSRYIRGVPMDFILFWSHDPRLEYGAFSQWANTPFTMNGVSYANAEQAMMAAKAHTFNDEVTLAEIMECVEPRMVKALGRQVRNYDDGVWSAVRLQIVTEITLAKFTSTPELTNLLVGTGDAVIVEASPYDKIWGIGLSPNNPNAVKPTHWVGLNLLGQALMDVRDQLRT